MAQLTSKILIGIGGATAFIAGCLNTTGLPGSDAALAPLVSAKATAVAQQVGGQPGFGGTLMNGYFDHAPMSMGFLDADDLADPQAGMMIRLQNNSAQASTCHISFVASFEGLDEQGMDVEVSADSETTVQIPCSEIVGLGPLEIPGGAACHLAGGEAIDNMMTVPGFLGLDYECGQMHRFMLTPDVDDLDGDGDTEELIMLSQGMQMHMLDGGPMGHQHGDEPGMMGPHMGQ